MNSVLQTRLGPMEMSNPPVDCDIADEIINRDSYKLRLIANHFTPQTIFDFGSAAGQVSMLARSIWPDASLTCVEMDSAAVEVTKKNCPSAKVVHGCLGYELRGAEFFKEYGSPDLLCCDCEGGEVPFFYSAFGKEGEGLDSLKVIVGEWHFWPARRLLEAVFQDRFHTLFLSPTEGAGQWSYFFAVRNKMSQTAELCKAIGITMQPWTTK